MTFQVDFIQHFICELSMQIVECFRTPFSYTKLSDYSFTRNNKPLWDTVFFFLGAYLPSSQFQFFYVFSLCVFYVLPALLTKNTKNLFFKFQYVEWDHFTYTELNISTWKYVTCFHSLKSSFLILGKTL